MSFKWAAPELGCENGRDRNGSLKGILCCGSLREPQQRRSSVRCWNLPDLVFGEGVNRIASLYEAWRVELAIEGARVRNESLKGLFVRLWLELVDLGCGLDV